MSKKKENEAIGLHIGCGSNILDGWVNGDIFPQDERVRFLDATNIFPFNDETFNFAFSEHMLEHVPYRGGMTMLSEVYRVLKPGGVFRLTIPTLNFLINLFEHKDDTLIKSYIDWSIDRHGCSECAALNGSKACFVINNFYRFWGHKMIYDEDTIIEMLRNVGFKDVNKVWNSYSEYPELRNVNGHGNDIPKEYNELESTTFEAKK